MVLVSAGLGIIGSRVMPHFGQLPGLSETTSGCIRQVYFLVFIMVADPQKCLVCMGLVGAAICYPAIKAGSAFNPPGDHDQKNGAKDRRWLLVLAFVIPSPFSHLVRGFCLVANKMEPLLFDCPTLTPDTAKTSRVLSKGVHLLARAGTMIMPW
jgi:hypothetical protein